VGVGHSIVRTIRAPGTGRQTSADVTHVVPVSTGELRGRVEEVFFLLLKVDRSLHYYRVELFKQTFGNLTFSDVIPLD
jgi:hypothetical protein